MSINAIDNPHKPAPRLTMRLALLATVVMFCGPAEAGFFEELFREAPAPIASPTQASRSRAPRRIDHVPRAAERPAASAADAKAATVIHAKATWAGASAPAPARLVSLSKDAQPRRARFCAKDDNSPKIVDATHALMQDPTLQRGDAVVTEEGVRVFEGRKVCPHAISDFRTLGETRALSPGARTILVEIERDLKTKNVDRSDRPIVATDLASNSGR
jgi:hypothetical protein